MMVGNMCMVVGMEVGMEACLDKIKTFHAHSLNLSKLSVKVCKLRQQNLRQKMQNLLNQESEIIFFGIGLLPC